MADAQASGACYGNIVWVQVPSPDLVLATACGFKSHLPHEKRESKDSLFSSLLSCVYGTVAQPG